MVLFLNVFLKKKYIKKIFFKKINLFILANQNNLKIYKELI